MPGFKVRAPLTLMSKVRGRIIKTGAGKEYSNKDEDDHRSASRTDKQVGRDILTYWEPWWAIDNQPTSPVLCATLKFHSKGRYALLIFRLNQAENRTPIKLKFLCQYELSSVRNLWAHMWALVMATLIEYHLDQKGIWSPLWPKTQCYRQDICSENQVFVLWLFDRLKAEEIHYQDKYDQTINGHQGNGCNVQFLGAEYANNRKEKQVLKTNYVLRVLCEVYLTKILS